MNLPQVVGGIRQRLVRADHRGACPEDFLPLRNQLSKLRSSSEQLYDLRHLVGRMPPQPATLRARVGAPLVRFVQRLLFWYSPQINRVNEAHAVFAGLVVAAMKTQLELMEKLSERIDSLEAEVRARPAGMQQTMNPPLK